MVKSWECTNWYWVIHGLIHFFWYVRHPEFYGQKKEMLWPTYLRQNRYAIRHPEFLQFMQSRNNFVFFSLELVFNFRFFFFWFCFFASFSSYFNLTTNIDWISITDDWRLIYSFAILQWSTSRFSHVFLNFKPDVLSSKLFFLIYMTRFVSNALYWGVSHRNSSSMLRALADDHESFGTAAIVINDDSLGTHIKQYNINFSIFVGFYWTVELILSPNFVTSSTYSTFMDFSRLNSWHRFGLIEEVTLLFSFNWIEED